MIAKAFKKSVGLNGVGAKAVNALSTEFVVQAFRDGQTKRAKFEYGKLTEDDAIIESSQRKGPRFHSVLIPKYLSITDIYLSM